MDYSGYAEHNKVRSENKSELILCVTRSVTGRASHIFNVLYAVVYTAVHTLSAKTVQCTLYTVQSVKGCHCVEKQEKDQNLRKIEQIQAGIIRKCDI